MTASELIEKLKEYPPEMQVVKEYWLNEADCCYQCYETIEGVYTTVAEMALTQHDADIAGLSDTSTVIYL